jgi:general secretion pathway protein E
MLTPSSPMGGGPSKELPTHIKSRTELPRGRLHTPPEGHVLHLNEEARRSMAVWIIEDGVKSAEKKTKLGLEAARSAAPARHAWLMYSPDYEATINYHNYRTTLRRNGFKIDHAASIDNGVLQALYDDKEETADDDAQQKNDLIKYYEQMVGDAMKEHVSDIHVERRRSRSVIRMRKHGEMLNYREVSSKYANSLCSVIYNVLAENKEISFSEDDYQSAAVNTNISGVEVKLRYQSLPAYPGGFDVVMRVLPIGDEDETFVDLEKLGYTPSQVQTLLDVAGRPVGAMIIAGTTGSGKSTTLKNLLMFINAHRGYKVKIFTIEDPPEYRIPRVSQIPVVRQKNADYTKKSPFYDPLVATMRADPDILMIGEIRDQFTGDGLKKATQSGHQVLTTVHASSALGILDRLADFGISPNVMGSPEFLTGLIYQKLLPLLCSHCSTLFVDRIKNGHASAKDLAMQRRLELVSDLVNEPIRVRNPGGCKECKGMGVSSRTVCAEIIAPDFTLLKLFRQQKSIEAYEYWRSLSDGDTNSDNMTGKTVLEHALQKMRMGMVSPYDVEDVLGPVDSAKKMLEQLRNERLLQEEQARKKNQDQD